MTDNNQQTNQLRPNNDQFHKDRLNQCNNQLFFWLLVSEITRTAIKKRQEQNWKVDIFMPDGFVMVKFDNDLSVHAAFHLFQTSKSQFRVYILKTKQTNNVERKKNVTGLPAIIFSVCVCVCVCL